VETLLHVGLTNAVMAAGLAVLAAAVSGLCRRPALTHALWLLVLVKLLTPPLVNLPIPWYDNPVPAAGEPLAQEQKPALVPDEVRPAHEPADEGLPAGELLAAPPVADQGVPSEDPPALRLLVESGVRESSDTPAGEVDSTAWQIPWPLLLGTAWLAGSVWWFALCTLRILRFQRLLQCAWPASEGLRRQTAQMAQRLGLAGCPAVSFVPSRVSPMLWALGRRPQLLVPAGLWQRLGEDQRAALLTHELAHLRRGDAWVRGLEILATGLYWWHPVVWWACREIREAQEQLCDAWVVWALPGTARAYATALVETVDFLSETPSVLPAVASGLGPVQGLRRRITMIMQGTTPRALSAVGLLAVLGLGVVLLPLVPTWGQTPASRQEPPDGSSNDYQRGDDLDRARDQVKRMADQVDRMRQEMARAVQALKLAQDDLARAEEARKSQVQHLERFGSAPRAENSRGRRPDGPRDVEQRLSEMERKLDMVLEEVRALRNDMRPGRRAGGGPPGALPGGGRPPGPGALAPNPPTPPPPLRRVPAAPSAPPPPGAAPTPPALPTPAPPELAGERVTPPPPAAPAPGARPASTPRPSREEEEETPPPPPPPKPAPNGV
jgi:beta-lactamase regulating signal transducer with metallopeptidase domain